MMLFAEITSKLSKFLKFVNKINELRYVFFAKKSSLMIK